MFSNGSTAMLLSGYSQCSGTWLGCAKRKQDEGRSSEPNQRGGERERDAAFSSDREPGRDIPCSFADECSQTPGRAAGSRGEHRDEQRDQSSRHPRRLQLFDRH